MENRVLVYGAGVIGSVYALRFATAGYKVSVVARGERLEAIRRSGIRIRHALTGLEESAAVDVLERPPHGSAYDLILIVLRSGQIDTVLEELRAAEVSGPRMALGNNLGNLAAQSGVAGEKRFILGFGAFGGYREGDAIVYLDGRSKKRVDGADLIPTTAGILSEGARPAFEAVRRLFAGAGITIKESRDMPAWLLCHAALVFPLAGAMYAAGGGQGRFCRTRDAILLGVRACKEMLGALRGLGWSLEPSPLRFLVGVPECLIVPILAKRLAGEEARVAMFGHANAPGGRDELDGQSAVLDGIVKKSGRRMDAWDRLLPFFSGRAEPLPDGSRELSLRLW
jgi:2-dehydropantoate 2-reductase